MISRALFRAEDLLRRAVAAGPVLGLETGGSQASLALVAGGRVVGRRLPQRSPHGESLATEVRELLRARELAIRDLTAIAVGIGPGSFTGLRISLSYAKGIASAGNCAVVGIPSLDAFAWCAATVNDLEPETTVCPLFDARKGEVYTAVYRFCDAGLERHSEDLVIRPAELVARLAGKVVFAGDGAAAYAHELAGASSGLEAAIVELPERPVPAEMVALLGAVRVADNQLDNVRGLEPRYLRPPEAVLKARAAGTPAGLEVIWSNGKKFSSTNTLITTKN